MGRTRLIGAALLTSALAVAGTVGLHSGAAGASTPRYHEYVALGDSWTAD